jgi:hypothetical protein
MMHLLISQGLIFRKEQMHCNITLCSLCNPDSYRDSPRGEGAPDKEFFHRVKELYSFPPWGEIKMGGKGLMIR